MRPQLLLFSLALCGSLWAQPAQDWKAKAEQRESQEQWNAAEQAWRRAHQGFLQEKQVLQQATSAFYLGRLLFSQKT